MPRVDFRLGVVISLTLLAACGGGASYQISIRNASSRPIEELYVYRSGSAKHGSSHGPLAPNASTAVSMKEGHVLVDAKSSKIQINEHLRDQPSASQEVELTAPVEIVFYDEGAAPAGIERKGIIGVPFHIPKPAPGPDEPTTQPAGGDQPSP